MNDLFNSIDEKKLERAINLVKEMLGPNEAEKLEKSFNMQKKDQILDGLTSNDIATVKTFIENPELLRKVLSSPKGKEIIKNIIN